MTLDGDLAYIPIPNSDTEPVEKKPDLLVQRMQTDHLCVSLIVRGWALVTLNFGPAVSAVRLIIFGVCGGMLDH
jgi:hypothetical protein